MTKYVVALVKEFEVDVEDREKAVKMGEDEKWGLMNYIRHTPLPDDTFRVVVHQKRISDGSGFYDADALATILRSYASTAEKLPGTDNVKPVSYKALLDLLIDNEIPEEQFEEWRKARK